MNAHTAASGSSASAASAIASHVSPPPCEVTTSNHASQQSIVPVTAASGTSHCEPRNAAHAVAANEAASATSKPTQATSLWSVTCRDGSVKVRYRIHGTSPTATTASSTVIQRGRGIRAASSARSSCMCTLYPGRVTLRPVSAERLLAWAAALVGVVGLVSALTPEMADRVDMIGGVLPPGWPEAARVLTVAFGLGLVWLSRSLAKRRRRAWQLAVAVVVASAAAHLAKGLDFEEAAVSLLLLMALVRWRRRFDVPGDPASVRPLVGLAVALAGVAAVAGGAELRGVDLSPRSGDALLGLGSVLGALALYFWLRPFGHAVAQTVGEPRLVRTLVDAYGSDSLAFFALRRDKSYLFSPSRRAFLAYRVVAGTALVSGDPVGDEAEIEELLGELRRLARARGWRFAVVGASEDHLDRYRAFGLKPIPIGEEAVLRPQEFSLEGRAIRKVRQSVSRLRKAGYSFRVVAADEVEPALEAGLAQVSNAWRCGQPERGFSMTIDDLHIPGTVLALAEDGDGRIGGFLHLAPSPAGGGWSLSAMRRRPDTPNGLTEV